MNLFILFKDANLLIGPTVAGYGNGSSGSGSQGLNEPRGIYVSPLNEALYVSDAYNYRAQRFNFGTRTGVTVAGGNGAG
jgi:DNA-binding beta-propeller fold protein YncE